MNKSIKKVVLGILITSMVIGNGVTSLASCNPWRYKEASTYCSTPMCNGLSTPTNYVSKKYERTCLDVNDKTYTETKNEVSTNGCC